MQRGLFFSLLWRSVVSKCISSDQLTAGSATSFSSLITVILFLPYQCYHPPCHSKTWWPAGILVHPGDKPFTFLLPNLSQSRSPHHILCQSHPSQHLIPDPHLPHFIFQQSLAMAIYTIPANQTLRVFQCLDILYFFFFCCILSCPCCPCVSISASICPPRFGASPLSGTQSCLHLPALPFPHLKYRCSHAWQSCSAPTSTGPHSLLSEVVFPNHLLNVMVLFWERHLILCPQSVHSRWCRLSWIKHVF